MMILRTDPAAAGKIPACLLRLSSGAYYQGAGPSGDLRWTWIPSWAHVFRSAAELAEITACLDEDEYWYVLTHAAFRPHESRR